MKKYSHAWLAFMAIKRLKAKLEKLSGTDLEYAKNLILWFMEHKDGVMQGAWFPDSLIKDMGEHHVLKITPFDKALAGYTPDKFKPLPKEYLIFKYGKDSPVRQQGFNVSKTGNLPDRCESLTEAVIDQLKVQEYEEKGSPVSPTHNQVALWLFMLSHYVADAHVPLHCDGRQFPKRNKIHDKLEAVWDDEIMKYYKLNTQKTRFLYDKDGYPYLSLDSKNENTYQQSFLKTVVNNLDERDFSLKFGSAKNVWDFMDAVCHNSYLLSYRFFSPQYEPDTFITGNWKTRASPALTIEQLSVAVLADAIDSITRVWFFVWSAYEDWKAQPNKKKDESNTAGLNTNIPHA